MLPRTQLPVAAHCRVVVDNDWAGDPDGLVALAHHLLSPTNRVTAVTSSFLDPVFGEVEAPAVVVGRGPDGRAAPGDLRAAVRRADRGLLVLVADQRPVQRPAPEVADRLRAVARERSDEAAVGEEPVAGSDDAELVALGVAEHHVVLLRALTDVDVPAAQPERPLHRPLLVLQRRAGQVEVPPVLRGLRLPRRHEAEPEAGVVGRHERGAVALPPQDTGPEAREPERVERVDVERDEVTGHGLRISDPPTRARAGQGRAGQRR